MFDPVRSHFAIPPGSRLSPMADHREAMSRHVTLNDYSIPLFMRDLSAGLVLSDTLEQHLDCLRSAETERRGVEKPVSRERILEMIQDTYPNESDLNLVEDAVLVQLGLKALMTH
jgi:hypothetical protein